MEDHPNGNDYLFCGEDYQGYSLINLTTGAYKVHRPEAMLKGFGFCFASVSYSPDFKKLVVHGCYWACPYEVRVYDISDIEQDVLDYPLFVSDHFRLDHVRGWESNTVIDCSIEEDYDPQIQKYEREMTDKEFDDCDSNDRWETHHKKVSVVFDEQSRKLCIQ
jgi:hypothetical protein